MNIRTACLFMIVSLMVHPVARADSANDEDDDTSVSFSPEAGLVVSSGGFQLDVHVASWFRADLVERDDQTQVRFSVPLARPWIRASFLDGRIATFFQPELAGTPRLLDLHLDVRIVEGLSIRMGQFRTPFSRAYVNPIITLALPDRGVVSDTFRLDRDTGLMFFGNPLDGALEYSFAVVNGAQINDLGQNAPAPLVIARLVGHIGDPVGYDQVPWGQWGDAMGLAIGGAAGYQRRFDDTAQTIESWNVNGEVTFFAGRIMVLGEVFLRRSRAPSADWGNDFGGYAQGTVMLVPETLDVSARFGRMEIADAHTTAVELGTNLYWWQPALRHAVKLQLRYLWTKAALTEHSGRLQAQLSF